jgi:eukaryotic-like serine/threonine-protein kinase
MTWKKVLLYTLLPFFVFFVSIYLTIDLLLKGGDNVICPDVRGKTVDEAREVAKKTGLPLVVLRYENRSDVPYNHITVQKPEANIPIRKGRIINVIVSEGPKLTEVPNLAGKTLQEAEETLREKNLEVGKIIHLPNARDGKIITQLPKGGEKTLERKEVTLFVGLDKVKYFFMPDVKDLSLWDIQDEMNAKRLKYKITPLPNNGKITQEGTLKLSLPPRTIFKVDDEVFIYINAGG